MIKFSCTGCGMPFEVADAHAGRAGNCPRCGAPFVTPQPATAAPPRPAVAEVPLDVPDHLLGDAPAALPDDLARFAAGPGVKLHAPGAPGAPAPAPAPSAKPVSDRVAKKASDRVAKKASDRVAKKASDRVGRTASDRQSRKGKSDRQRKGKSGRARREGSDAQEVSSTRFRQKKGSGILPLLGAFFVLAGVAGLIGFAAHKALTPDKPSTGGSGGNTDGDVAVVDEPDRPKKPRKTGGGGGPVAVDNDAISRQLEDMALLLEELSEEDDLASRKDDLERLRAEWDGLDGSPMNRTNALFLKGNGWRLEALERKAGVREGQGPQGSTIKPPDTSDDDRVRAAWVQIGGAFERILFLALRQPSASFQARAEAELGGARFRQDLLGRVWKASQDDDPWTVIDEALRPEWSALLGTSGYDALDRTAGRFPADLRSDASWKRWSDKREELLELKDRAKTFGEGVQTAWRAYVAKDLQAARDAFATLPAGDPWGKAMLAYLNRPAVKSAFGRGSGASSGSGSFDPPTSSGTLTRGAASALDWRARFAAQVKTYRQDADARPGAVEAISEIVTVVSGLARRSFAECEEALETFEGEKRLFKKEAVLAERLKELHEVYFEAAFERCSGPSTFRALDRWCKERGYDAWREQLKPFLDLVKRSVGRPARESKRAQRAKTIRAVRRFSRGRVQKVVDGIQGIVDWMREATYAPAGAKRELDGILARAVERAGDPLAGARLRAVVAGLKHSADDAESQQKAYRKKVDKLIKRIVSDSLDATTRAVKAGEPGMAFDLFQYVLLLDPENERAHKGLGHVKVQGQWLRRYRAQQLKQGLAWDPRRAWVLRKETERYERGEIYELDRKAWRSLSEADRVHSQPSNPWVIRTEHFELRSTAALHRTAWIADRLESYYLNMFRQYDLFFAKKGGAALIFGLAPAQQRPMVVNFYRDRQQYNAYADPIPGSAGYYSSGKRASFFYDEGEDVATLQHEITHQILGEASPGSAHAWLAEGAAVFLQYAHFRDGVMTLGDSIADNPRVDRYVKLFPRGGEHTFTAVMGLESQAAWNAGLSAGNYRGAGAAVYFLCNFDDGRYRADFVEMLRDGYYGKPVKVEDYMSLPRATLDKLMRRFYGLD